MKALGIVRKIDDLGRIVIPKEMRDKNGWAEGQLMEFFASEDGMFIKPYGRDAEKAELVEQLNVMAQTTDCDENYAVLEKAIKFIEKF